MYCEINARMKNFRAGNKIFDHFKFQWFYKSVNKNFGINKLTIIYFYYWSVLISFFLVYNCMYNCVWYA